MYHQLTGPLIYQKCLLLNGILLLNLLIQIKQGQESSYMPFFSSFEIT
jgi:hypothetical protein